MHSAELGSAGDLGPVRHVLDADGDGELDLLGFGEVAGVPTVQVRLGVGGAVFGAPIVSNFSALDLWIGAGDDRSAAADFDGDGFLDLIASAEQAGSGVVALVHGVGDGTFVEGGYLPVPAVFQDTRLAAIEVEGNVGDIGSEFALARQDVGVFETVVEVVDWDGSAFTVIGATAPFLSVFRRGLEVADFDGDGDLDLALDGAEPTVVLQMAGVLEAPVEFADGLALGGRQLLAADVDGDGYLDLVQVGPQQVVVALNDGAGEFIWGLPEALAPEPLGAEDFGSAPRMFAFDDDGDGRDELWGKLRAIDASSLVPAGGQVLVRLAFDEFGALAAEGYVPDASVEAPVGPADLDGDGVLDVVAARAWRSGTAGVPVELDVVGGSLPAASRRVVLDVDLDGDADLVGEPLPVLGEDPTLLLNNAAAEFSAGTPFVGGAAAMAAVPALGPDERALGLLSGDFDLDGRPELWLAVEQESDPVLPPIDLGWRRFELEPGGAYVEIGTPANTTLGVAGDLPLGWLLDVDGDGLPDLVTSDGSYLLGDGVDALAPAQKLSGGGQILAAQDVDGDGLQDLLVAGADLELFTNDGAGGYIVQTLAIGAVSGAALTDADADGDLDAVVVHAGAVELFENVGGVLSAAPLVLAGLGEGAAGIRWDDVDGDGELDLIAALTSLPGAGGASTDAPGAALPGRLVVARGLAGAFDFEPLVAYVVWPDPVLGDFDADGDLDVFGTALTMGQRFQDPEAGRIEQFGAGVVGSAEYTPLFGGLGPVDAGSTSAGVRILGVPGGTKGWVAIGRERALLPDAPFAGLTAYIGDLERIVPISFNGNTNLPGEGGFEFVFPDLTPYLGLTRMYQAFLIDGGSPNGLVTSSNAVEIRFGAPPSR